MIQDVRSDADSGPIALDALRRAAQQAINLARQTSTPAGILENETLVDAAKPGSADEECIFRQAAIDTLSMVWEQCRNANWDGEGAEAISTETHDVARRLLEALPSGTPLPSISAEPDGQLNFEWYQAPRRLLSASISPVGTVYWAALIGSEDPRGSCQFVDQFPQTLLYWIGQVYG